MRAPLLQGKTVHIQLDMFPAELRHRLRDCFRRNTMSVVTDPGLADFLVAQTLAEGPGVNLGKLTAILHGATLVTPLGLLSGW